MTASSGGVSLKLMPDAEGGCVIEDNPEPFSMETNSMGKAVIDAHSFFNGHVR